MRVHLFLPALTLAVLLGGSAGGVRAGSFFGPICYGARYTYQYPNRSHNLFGCGPDCHCQAWHPLLRHRWFRRHSDVPVDGIPAQTMPGYGMPPVTGTPIESMQAPIVQSPMIAPLHMTSPPTAGVPAAPAVRSRLVPVPTSASSGPMTIEPPPADPPPGKAPF